jgi:hypothetical protein
MAKLWKQPRCPSINENKLNAENANNRLYSTRKGRRILTGATTWTCFEDILLHEIN